MGLYARLRGNDINLEKIPVWPFICSFTAVMDSKMSISSMYTLYNMSTAEQTELVEYINAVKNLITTNIQRRVGEGQSVTSATESARVYWFAKVWQILINVENGFMDEATLRSEFGLS